jgi:molybdate transport system substrate-binding protein
MNERQKMTSHNQLSTAPSKIAIASKLCDWRSACWLFLLIHVLWSAEVMAESLRVAVASNFAEPLGILAVEFQQQTGHSLEIIPGSSGKLFAQISQGAPFDVFLSADTEKPQALVTKGLAKTTFAYTQGKLILAQSSPRSLKQLKQESALTIAIANPRVAPYGKAALEVLALWFPKSEPQPRLVIAESVAQVSHYVRSGSVTAGFVAESLWQDPDSPQLAIEDHLYAPILQDGTFVWRGQSPAVVEAGEQFQRFLTSATVQQRLAEMGYLPLPDQTHVQP